MRWKDIAKSGVGKKERRSYRSFPPISIPGFKYGLNTNSPITGLLPEEASELINFGLLPDGSGKLFTRPGLEYALNYAGGTVSFLDMVYGSIGGTNRYIFSADDQGIYYENAGSIQVIAGAEGNATLLLYNNVCLVLDGSYIKYLDGVSALKMAYDDGNGPSGYQIDTNSIGEVWTPGGIPFTATIGDGTTTRRAQGFTSQAWDSGYTIPPTTVTASFRRFGDGYTGTDNVGVVCSIRKRSDDSVCASKTIVPYPLEDNLLAYPEASTEFSVTFDSGDITTELASDTDYYLSFEYANGDASHHVLIDLLGNPTYADDGSDTDRLVYTYTGSWTGGGPLADAYIKCSLKPGRPPKGSFGIVHRNRPFIAGDPDNPGYVWFGNLTHLDWSTIDGGGYVSTVDDNSTSYPVGALQTLFKQLFVFGTEANPFLTQLTGASPTEYELPNSYPGIWTDKFAVAATANDIFFVNKDSVANLAGVELYGDMRTSPVADPVKDRLIDNWDTGALMEFYPDDNQMWIQLPGYSRVLVCHVGQATRYKGTMRYPWVEYSFPFEPTLMKYINGYMYLSDDDSNIYRISSNSTEYRDEGESAVYTNIPFSAKSGMMTPHIDSINIVRFNVQVATLNGASFDLSIYKESGASPILAFSYDLSDASGDWQFLDNDGVRIQEWINAFVYKFQFEVDNVILSGSRTVIGDFEFHIQPLET